MVTHSPPTSEVGSSNPRPCVGKLVVDWEGIVSIYHSADQLKRLESHYFWTESDTLLTITFSFKKF